MRLRLKARRQGLTLHKSRVRDPDALDFGRYWLASEGQEQNAHGLDVAGRASLTLDDIEAFLTRASR